jgi:hypothetical protein
MVLWTFGEPVDLETLKQAVKRLAPGGEETEFDFQFTDALRQLDGNFISTDRYSGTTKKSGHFIVVQFSNPSIEEFIDGFLRSDTSLIERLTKSIVCFRQVSELFTQTSSQKVPGLSPSFWNSLREAAALVEKVSGGRLINFRPSDERVRRVWDVPSVDWPDQTLVRLQIEAEARLGDELSDELQRRVSTADGWRLIVAGSQYDGFQCYHVKSLHAWVRKESGWPPSIINTCQAALRRAVFLSLTDEDNFWTGSIDSLRTLAEVVLSSGLSLTGEEKKAFHAAGKFATETLVENAETADEVRDEISELEQLAKTCGLEFRREIAELESTADDLEGRGSSDNFNDPESTHVSQSAAEEEFDMDALFAGLLDK